MVLGRGTSTFVAGLAVVLASFGALEVGIVAAVLGALFHRKSLGVIFIRAAVAALSGWAFMRIAVLLNPVFPTDSPFALDRGATAVALDCSVAAAVLAVRSGALVLRLPELDFDEDDAAKKSRLESRLAAQPPADRDE